ncbi:MAG: hypothetical protein GXO22_01740 [Aquificae bacterium]|nr:hypothetical protein [Aquificota bacterium]
MKRHLFLLFEAVIVYLLTLFVSYLLNPQDPLYIDKLGINVYLFVLLIVTLFYGIWYGFVGIIILYVFSYYYYSYVDYYFLLIHILLVLIAGIFYFFYIRRIENLEEEKYFLNDRFNSLAKNFYLLKIAYENLEKNYLLKPFSLRDLLRQIRNQILLDFGKSVSDLFSLIVNTFSIEEGSLYVKMNGDFKQVQFVGYPSELKLSDDLVKMAFDKKEIVFVSDLRFRQKTDYLAVIPVLDEKDEIISVMIIKKMPFVKFNMDTVFSISLLLAYFFDDIHIKDKLKEVGLEHLFCDFDFHKELYKLSLIRKKYRKESTVVIIRITNSDLQDELKEVITRRARSTDIYCLNRFVIVILPLTAVSGAESFINRLKADISSLYPVEYVKSLDFSIVPIRKTYIDTIKNLQGLLPMKTVYENSHQTLQGRFK